MNTQKKRGRPPKIVKEQVEVITETPTEPEIINATCLRQHPNPMWIRANIKGEAVNVKIHRKYANKLVGKPIKVVKVSPENQDPYYEYVP